MNFTPTETTMLRYAVERVLQLQEYDMENTDENVIFQALEKLEEKLNSGI